MDLKK
jgi:hypothetical protein